MRRDSATFASRLALSWPILVVLQAMGFLLCQANAQGSAAEAGADDAVQVMTRGPVHEAYAAPLINDPKPGPVITRQSPSPVEEIPPDQKPAGAEVQWIPGYWQWDQGRGDFLWISGVWRDPPPGRQWVPGYWNQVQGGYQWVPGGWLPEEDPPPSAMQNAAGAAPGSGQAAYLPAPPATLEVGPSSPAPTGEVFWSPGCWSWHGARYVWQPGFWAAVQPGWVWMPSQYLWTPGGFVFVPGYWDLPLASRGLLFAPVYYPQPIYLQPGYVYTPSVTIVSSSFTANLFVQPAYSHYCFGDYYAQSFLSVGIFPWFSFSYATGPRMPRYYDPLFSYYSVVNARHDPHWSVRVREEYIVRRDNISMRPPRTLVEQTRMVRIEGPRGNSIERVQIMARPVGELARHPEELHAMRLERIDAAHHRQIQQRVVELNRYRDQRMNLEREGGRMVATAPHGGHSAPRPMTLSSSPIKSRPIVTQGHADRGISGPHGRRDELVRASVTRPAHTRRSELTHSPNQARAGTAASNDAMRTRPRSIETPRIARSERPSNPLGAQRPAMSHPNPHLSVGRPGSQGSAERRVPPHPTPVHRERREHPRG